MTSPSLRWMQTVALWTQSAKVTTPAGPISASETQSSLAESPLYETMPTPNKKRPIPQDGPQQPGEIDVDVDDAQVEEPKDDAFEKGEPNKSPRLEK